MNWKNWSISVKLTLAFVVVILLGLGAVGDLSYQNARDSLMTETENKLVAVRTLKKGEIESYFNELMGDIEVLAELKSIEEQTDEFANAFEAGISSTQYKELESDIGHSLDKFCNMKGWYDVFLIDTTGRIIYSEAKEDDYGTNLINGPYSNSGLAKAFQKGRQETTISDFAYYEVSGEAASFIATPIRNDETNQLVGVLALQIPVDQINDLMQERTGMGESGELYLVGADKLMRSDSRFSQQSTILDRKVDTVTVSKALNGQSGVEITEDYLGNQVLSSYSPVRIKGMDWAIVSEIDRAEIMKPVRRLLTVVIWVVVIALVIAIIITLLLVRGIITNPIKRVQATLAQVSKQDLTVQTEILSEDELGEMLGDLNDTVRLLNNALTRVKQSAMNVSNSSTEIAEGNQDLSQRTQEQASSLEEVSATMEEVNSSIQEIASNSEHADDIADETMEAVEEGSQVVEETMESMEEITTSSNEIADIITTVNDIAFQTNLLALNAAVEAARAGEHGKGFAVVAAEVRNLASRTAKSAEEIENLISSIIEQIEKGNHLVGKTGEALDDIIKNSRETSQVVSEIAAAMEEQSSAAGEIQGAVEQLDQVTQQNASMVEEIASSSEALNGEAENLANVVREFKLEAGGLSQAVNNNSNNFNGNQTETVNNNVGSIDNLESEMDQNFDADEFDKF
ncbi:MAG: methyl-accepting chemotaxis protein [Bacillota bacterium]